MKRLVGLGLVAALGVMGTHAHAAVKPIPMKFYFHGTQRVGEAEGTPVISSSVPVMDTKAPTGADSKSKQVLNYVGGPNTQCAGNSLFPFWVGNLAGDVTGPAKISFTAIGAPGSSVVIRLFQDVDGQACNEQFPKVVGTVTVALPAGQGKVEATINKVKIKAKHSFMVQFSPQELSADEGRIFYDSTTDPSSISFGCVPAPRKKSC